MKTLEQNQKRYIYRFLVRIIRYFYAQWYLSSQEISNFSINICDAVYGMGRYKMEKIKQFVYENAFIHEKLWIVYDKIKDFQEIADLLVYLSSSPCHGPEQTLLNILRCSSKIRILNTDIPGLYRICPVGFDQLPELKIGYDYYNPIIKQHGFKKG